MAEPRMLFAAPRQPAGDYNIGSGASGALSGAATGAAVGSYIPVIGTAVGAVVGAIVGLLGGFGDEPEDHTGLTLAKRAAVGYGWVPRGEAGMVEFKRLLLSGDARALALAQQSGVDEKKLAVLRAQASKRANRGGGPMVGPPLTVAPSPPISIQPVGQAIPLSGGQTFAMNAISDDDEPPPQIAALMAFLTQVISLGRVPT